MTNEIYNTVAVQQAEVDEAPKMYTQAEMDILQAETNRLRAEMLKVYDLRDNAVEALIQQQKAFDALVQPFVEAISIKLMSNLKDIVTEIVQEELQNFDPETIRDEIIDSREFRDAVTDVMGDASFSISIDNCRR